MQYLSKMDTIDCYMNYDTSADSIAIENIENNVENIEYLGKYEAVPLKYSIIVVPYPYENPESVEAPQPVMEVHDVFIPNAFFKQVIRDNIYSPRKFFSARILEVVNRLKITIDLKEKHIAFANNTYSKKHPYG